MAVIQNIKHLLKLKKISVVELSQLIGVSDKSLYDAFRREDMKLKTIEDIAEALDVPITIFFKQELDNNDSKIFLNNNKLQIAKGDNISQMQEYLESKLPSKEEEAYKEKIKYMEKMIKLLEQTNDMLTQKVEELENK